MDKSFSVNKIEFTLHCHLVWFVKKMKNEFATGNSEIIFKARLKLVIHAGRNVLNAKKLLRTLADHGLLKSLWSKSLTRRGKG